MKQERTPKESLSVEKIELDLLARIERVYQGKSSYSLHDLLKYNGRFALIAGVLAAVCVGIKYYAVAILLIAVGIAILGIGLIPILVSRRRAQNERQAKLQTVMRRQYRIVCDRLERVRHDASTYLQMKSNQGSELLEFARYGSYMIPCEPHYTWSKDYHMSAEGVFNTSIEGDKFYLVIIENDGRQTIAMIYNTKFFKLQDEDPFDCEELS